MIGQSWYNQSIRNAVAVFGSLFNNIVIQRKDGKLLPVPIAYGPRTKWMEAQKQFDKEEEMFEKLLPRMSYEMVAMNYDVNRKLTNKQKVMRTPDSSGLPRQTVHVPVPYNLDFTLYVHTKNLNDGWQIIEQILPFFTPAYTVRVRDFPLDGDPETPGPTNERDMPFTLTSLSWADDWTGDIADRRIVEWTLEFSTKIDLYGPVSKTNIIFDSRAIVSTPESGVGLSGLNRASNQEGTEVGWVSVDSEIVSFDSDGISPTILNLMDSDGNITKIIRTVDSI